MPIPNSLTAEDLYGYLIEIVDGLVTRGIKVISYACDGTEVERAVQRLLVSKATARFHHVIKNPRLGLPDTELIIPIIHEQKIAIIQDSKHALKTLRNNLYSGARLLTMGSFVAMYCHVRGLAFEDGSPLYHRDVEKVDRQDDNAASRLFSAEFLAFVCGRRPELAGLVVYLFVFAELVDAYQNRHIAHIERIQMLLRARYVLDYWSAYLDSARYDRTHYFLSREAGDIVRIIIEGLLSLIVIHRDEYSNTPLCPWLHSSEACEHVFGDARQIIKDFTMLNFFQMVVKLRLKLREAMLHNQLSNPKARASGYAHTYFNAKGIDMRALAAFPNDDSINFAAENAAQEAESLISLLGLVPEQLREGSSSFAPLPGIATWHVDKDDDEEPELDDEDSESVELEAEELQGLLGEAGRPNASFRTTKQDDQLMALSCAAVAVTVDEMTRLRNLPEPDEETHEELIAEESSYIQAALNLPAVQIEEAEKPFGISKTTAGRLDFSTLVELRRLHQTDQAAHGVRKTYTQNTDNQEISMRRQLIQKFREVLKEQQDHAVGTGLERAARTRAPAPGGHDYEVNSQMGVRAASGNSANAVATASAIAKKALIRRRQVFTAAGVPNLAEIAEARVSNLRPLCISDYIIVFTEPGPMVAKVLGLYSKTGGKNGKHGFITDSSNISAISNAAVQLFEPFFGGTFREIPLSMARWQTRQYALLPSTAILTRLAVTPKPASVADGIQLSHEDTNLFKTVQQSCRTFAVAMKLFRKRGKVAEDED